MELTHGRDADAWIDAVCTEMDAAASWDSRIDRVKVALFTSTGRPHVLHQAIHCCRNFGTVSIVGVYGGFLEKIPMNSPISAAHRRLVQRELADPLAVYASR